MSHADTMSILLVFAVMAVFLAAVVLRYSDCSFHVNVIAGRVLLSLSFLCGLASAFLVYWSDLDSLPEHTVNGLISTVSLTIVALYNVLKMFPPISMRD